VVYLHGEKRPAYKREDGVLGIWRCTRLEFYAALLARGANLSVFGDLREQATIFRLFEDEKLYLAMRVGASSSDDPPANTALLALMYGYLHLSEAGTESADPATSRLSLKVAGRSITSDLEQAVSTARKQWEEIIHGSKRDGKLPPTMIEILDADVLAKSKTIALTTRFGPHYEAGISHVEQLLRKNIQNAEADQFRREISTVLAANNPDMN
jgi:hypothetical protein